MTNEEILEKAKEYGYTNLFACPESSEALNEYVEQFSGSEKIVAYTVMGMTANFMSKMFAEKLLKEGKDVG